MDQDEFRAFYEKTVPQLRAYAIRCCGSIDLADDFIQEAFVRFLQSAPATLSEPQRRSYLYRTIENLIANRWRGLQHERKFVMDAQQVSAPANTSDMSDEMTHAFSKLDAKQRSLLWLAYVEGFDHKEIAVSVNLKEKSVRVLLFRARKALIGVLRSAGIGFEVL